MLYACEIIFRFHASPFFVLFTFGWKTKAIFNIIMANSCDTGSSVEISCHNCPLNAAISEVDKLSEKFEVFTSTKLTGSSDKSRKKIAFQDSGEELISCLSVMRRLMEDAENENRQLKQEKFLISSKIGNALGAVNREVEQLRAELQKQDRRLVELNNQTSLDKMKGTRGDSTEELRRTKEEKQRLEAENEVLNVRYHELNEKAKNLEHLREQVRTYKDDISRANQTINCINSERRRLKSEKHDLLGQLREAYCIIEDKESELRDFITTYEERMRESEQRLEVVTKEKRQWEDEKRILTNSTPAQIGLLKRQLDEKDAQMKQMEVELSDVKDQLRRLEETLKCSVFKWDNTHSPVPTVTVQHPDGNPESFITQDSSLVVSSPGQHASSDHLMLSSPDIYANRGTESEDLTNFKKRKRYSRLGLSRVFSRGKSKKTAEPRDHRPPSSLSSDGDSDTTDIVQIWETNKTIPISRWKAPAVIAFLHVYLQMPMYTDRCMENVKSGKVLADMNDPELTRALGIISFIHRRKIRLAIEDFRHPASMKYPKIGNIDHHFVAHDWLTHIGLDQYAFTFETQMIDGRLLNNMTRKDIEKYLNITLRSHQDSILYGVELLRYLDFDRETLGKRKEKCDEYNHDPLVWSNERVIRWCDSIKLKEHSSNLRSTGVHGGLLVLNHSFGPEELAALLNIPGEEANLRKHLVGELSSLMINARSAVKSRGSSKRSFRNRSKSFHRHSFRRTGAYNLVDDNSNDGELRKLTGSTRRTPRTVSPDVAANRRSLSVRRSATLERPKSTDCERNLVD